MESIFKIIFYSQVYMPNVENPLPLPWGLTVYWGIKYVPIGLCFVSFSLVFVHVLFYKVDM